MSEAVHVQNPHADRPSDGVRIDGRFLRETARDALIQFFVPITATFVRSSRKRRTDKRDRFTS